MANLHQLTIKKGLTTNTQKLRDLSICALTTVPVGFGLKGRPGNQATRVVIMKSEWTEVSDESARYVVTPSDVRD